MNRAPTAPIAELRCPAGDALAALAKRAWTSLLPDREATEIHCTELSRRGKLYLWLTGVESPGEFGPTIVRALIAPDGKPVHTDMDRESSYDVLPVAKDLDGDGEDELVRASTFAFDLSLAYLPVGRGLDIAVQCDVRRVWHWTGSNLVEVK